MTFQGVSEGRGGSRVRGGGGSRGASPGVGRTSFFKILGHPTLKSTQELEGEWEGVVGVRAPQSLFWVPAVCSKGPVCCWGFWSIPEHSPGLIRAEQSMQGGAPSPSLETPVTCGQGSTDWGILCQALGGMGTCAAGSVWGPPKLWVLPDPHPALEPWGLRGWLVALGDGGQQWALPESWEARPNGTVVSPHPITAPDCPPSPPGVKLGDGPRTSVPETAQEGLQVRLGWVSSYQLRSDGSRGSWVWRRPDRDLPGSCGAG